MNEFEYYELLLEARCYRTDRGLNFSSSSLNHIYLIDRFESEYFTPYGEIGEEELWLAEEYEDGFEF